jgi:phosphoglycolate phosphatase
MSEVSPDIQARIRAIRAILFDKDGTLIDFQKSWGPVLAETCRMAAAGDATLMRHLLERGGTDPETLITRADTLFAAGNTAEIADAFIAEGVVMERDQLIREADRLFVEAAHRAVPVCDLPGVFRHLRGAGFRLGIASSDSEAGIRQMLVTAGAEGLMDFVCGYDTGHGHKPEPGMALAFARKIGLAPASICVVGDNLHDMRMGRAAGCGLVIGVMTGTGTRERLSREGDLVLDSIADLPALLGA